jgi:two-component system, NarL family, response regulator
MTDRRCLVADDHPALLSALTAVVQEHGFEIVGPATTGLHAIELAAAEQPPLALVDLRMPGASGTELLSRLAEAAPAMRIGVYTAEADTELAAAALAAGAHALVLKEAPLADLARALDALSAGGSYLDPALAGAAFMNTPTLALTDRERQVLELLAVGCSYDEIAERLSLGAETVRTHVRKACTRLNASTRTQGVATALRLGLIA